MQRKVEDPFVSIILPVYNEEKHIEKCLISLNEQSYKQKELIVIDDGSTDSTLRIISKYVTHYMVQAHQGPAIARNKAAAQALGEILVFADGDMYFSRGYIEKLIKPILENKAEATYSTEEYIANSKSIWSNCWNIDHGIPLHLRMKYTGTSQYSIRAIKKTTFFKLKGFVPELGYRDDQILLKDKKIRNVRAKGAVCYHFNPESLFEIYTSARWIGRNPILSGNYYNLIRYSIMNSVIYSCKRILEGAPLSFLLYKIIFDVGITSGILCKNSAKNYAK